MKKTILTQQALDKLKKELEELKGKRKELTERIEKALEFGDLSENFEYHEAKDSQGLNESRIIELENLVKTAEVAENHSSDIINLGSNVEVEVNGQKKNFEIVSFNESNPAEGKISNESPIGQALIGHSKGDEVEVEIPSGNVFFKILEIT